MIVYDLQCQPGAHRFEGWFKSSDDFGRQQERGLLACPHCGSVEVSKAMQAPRLARKGNQLPQPVAAKQTAPKAVERVEQAAPAPIAPADMPLSANAQAALAEAFTKLAKMQAEVLKSSRNVGRDFVDTARAMHYGEQDAEAIHGEASVKEARELLEEGVSLMPLPLPIATPDKLN